MDNKELEKRLRSEADAHTPDVFDSVMSTAQTQGLFDNNAEHTPQPERKNRRDKKTFMRIFIPAATVAACAAVFVPMLLIKDEKPNNNNSVKSLSTVEKYGIGAVSAAKLLSAELPVAARGDGFYRASTLNSAISYSDGNDDIRNYIDAFDRYLSALDGFIGEGAVSAATQVNTDGNYPYRVKMTVKGLDFDGNQTEYIMYYTETVITDSTIVSQSDGDGKTPAERKKDEREVEYSLKGVMLLDDKEYMLEGRRKTENDGDESEEELFIRAYADPNDKTTYVQMEQESETESDEHECEYVYSVVVNGETVETTAIEFEVEDEKDKTKSELQLEFKQGKAKGKYSLKRVELGDETQTKVKYKLDGEEGEFRIVTANGKHEYLFD